MSDVTIYSNDDCALCRQANRLLDQRGVAYRELNLAMDDDGRRRLAGRTGRLTFPQIVVDDEPIGGYRERVELVRRGALASPALLERAA
jgi:glutaredoxin 3